MYTYPFFFLGGFKTTYIPLYSYTNKRRNNKTWGRETEISSGEIQTEL